jgi:hypothetical protein
MRRASFSMKNLKADYGFFLPAIFELSFYIVESILCVVSIVQPVSSAAGAGAGAMAGVVVSGFASSLEQAVTASTAATKARRFMTFS